VQARLMRLSFWLEENGEIMHANASFIIHLLKENQYFTKTNKYPVWKNKTQRISDNKHIRLFV
jgi:hypothetical protein